MIRVQAVLAAIPAAALRQLHKFMTMDAAVLLLFVVAGVGCLIAAAVVLIRAIKPFAIRANTTKTQLQCIDIEKGLVDLERIQHAAQRAGKLQNELGL